MQSWCLSLKKSLKLCEREWILRTRGCKMRFRLCILKQPIFINEETISLFVKFNNVYLIYRIVINYISTSKKAMNLQYEILPQHLQFLNQPDNLLVCQIYLKCRLIWNHYLLASAFLIKLILYFKDIFLLYVTLTVIPGSRCPIIIIIISNNNNNVIYSRC